MGHYKSCKTCGGKHRTRGAWNKCVRRNKKEYWS